MKEKEKIYIEYLGAYDGRMTYYYKEAPEIEYHRLGKDNKDNKVLQKFSGETYGDILFITEQGAYINLQEATWHTVDGRELTLTEMSEEHISKILRDVTHINKAYRAYFEYITHDRIFDFTE